MPENVQKIDPLKTIVLCLDIDDTLINYLTGEFNGSIELWKEALQRIKDDCHEQGFHFVVQIITAKVRVDHLVDKVAYELRAFLSDFSPDGERIQHQKSDSERTENNAYYMSFYKNNVPKIKQRAVHLGEGKTISPQLNGPFLPAIHFCTGNQAKQDGPGSKALVMQYISKYFGNIIPTSQMYLLDNSFFVQNDLGTGCNGRTPQYIFVSAHHLERYRYYPRETRYSICDKILNSLVISIGKKIKNESPACDLIGSDLLEPVVVTRRHSRSSNISTLYRSISTQHRSAFNQLLVDMKFEMHLSSFKEKANRKNIKAQANPQDDNLQASAQQADFLVAGLERAKVAFLFSQDSISLAADQFIQECINLLKKADVTLFNQSTYAHCLGLSSFFSTKKAYITNRNALMATLVAYQSNDLNLIPLI